MNSEKAKVIVITGASRGLGEALIPLLAEEGHRVFGCARSPAGVEALRKRFGPPHGFTSVDVRDAAAVKSWADSVIAEAGPPDLLLNNAALTNEPAPLWKVPPEEFAEILDVNVKGVFNVIRAFAPAMVERQKGVIVNLSSGWGRSTSPEVAPYCASKFAVEGLTQALAQELPKGMAAVPLNPGIIATDMLRQVWGESADSYPSAQEWAGRAAPFLLSLGPRDNGRSLSVS